MSCQSDFGVTAMTMTKEDFIDEFQQMNDRIETAIAARNFDLVVNIDESRRELLHQFTAEIDPNNDQIFFEALESCAKDNARAISKLKMEMVTLSSNVSSQTKALNGYQP
jgi:hypothetical protein